MRKDSFSVDSGLLWSAVGGTALGLATAFLAMSVITAAKPLRADRQTPASTPANELPHVSAAMPSSSLSSSPSLSPSLSPSFSPSFSPSTADETTAENASCKRVEADRSLLRLFEDAQVRRSYTDHDLAGVHVFEIKKGSFWDELGLRSGDLITEMNHAPIESEEASVDLLNYVGGSPDIHLRVQASDGRDREIDWDEAARILPEHCRP